MGAPGKKRTGGGQHGRKVCKSKTRNTFLARHIDQLWEDVRKPQGVHDGKHGPLGTTTKAELDEDLPAMGKWYCTPCSRYFISAEALAKHSTTKPHKRRLKELSGAKPHTALDAELAGGRGKPDNGPRLRSMPTSMDL